VPGVDGVVEVEGDEGDAAVGDRTTEHADSRLAAASSEQRMELKCMPG
jgi:hypothetical protein